MLLKFSLWTSAPAPYSLPFPSHSTVQRVNDDPPSWSEWTNSIDVFPTSRACRPSRTDFDQCQRVDMLRNKKHIILWNNQDWLVLCNNPGSASAGTKSADSCRRQKRMPDSAYDRRADGVRWQETCVQSPAVSQLSSA